MSHDSYYFHECSLSCQQNHVLFMLYDELTFIVRTSIFQIETNPEQIQCTGVVVSCSKTRILCILQILSKKYTYSI